MPEPSTEVLPDATAPAAGRGGDELPSLVGRALGKFALVELIGKGGSGEVFRAEQAQLGREVVVKVLRREIVWAPNRVERFLREAKLASRLDHPYAAHIYAFGAEADGVLWMAMELVRGTTLDELVARRGPLAPAVFAPLFERVCEVVHSAHELGIVHRDIKGGNVMVIERAGQLLPKLLDFGIAKSDDGETAQGVTIEGEHLTGHGVMLGSPHYMAPEQWQNAANVDRRADVYALGVLAYRCVGGWLPFRENERVALADAHLHRTPPPLPDAVPRGLADAIARALAKSPDARWPTALAFGAAVRAAAGTTAPEAVPIFDAATRDAWLRAGPQPIADAIAHVASAATTVDADAALRELVAITCRWLAVLALAKLPPSTGAGAPAPVRDRARAVIGSDDAVPWLRLARAAVEASGDAALPALVAVFAACEPLDQLAERLDARGSSRSAAALASDIVALADALRALEPLLAYQLVLGRGDGTAELWTGPRRRDRERVLVWGEPIAAGELALLDGNARAIAKLSPLAQVIAPLPSSEPELFLLWRGGRRSARMVAAPWGYERDDDALATRLAALSTEDSDTSAEPDERSPYPGLAAYGASDADRFVGREREIEALANRLVRAPLLAVLGPSGVGKSSFVHAGVVPRLAESHRVIAMRPGRHPLHALAALTGGDASDPDALVARLRELGESAARGLVIVVDQLEELATLCADRDERARFAAVLARAADAPSSPVRVVATIRDDFATVIESEAELRGRFEVFVLATPPPEALRRIVIEPARRSAVTIDASVVDDIVGELAGRPAALALLSFTAAQLWRTRDRDARTIGRAPYDALGGVAGALATYADELYASLARRDQEVVRDLFARLVAADGTRVPWSRAELEQLPGARGVIAHLVDARLLVAREDDAIEVVHECLAERWPRLARWRDEDAADRALLGDVRAAARRWRESGRRTDLLWRGEALAELNKLAARSTALTADERAFADACAHAARRARNVRRGVVAGAMVALAIAASAMAYLRSRATASAELATRAAQLAEDRLTQSLVAAGRRELNDGRALAALAYFAEALRRGADGVGLREMIAIASRAWRDTLVVDRVATVVGVVGSPNGWIAAADRDGHVRFWTDAGATDGVVDARVGPIAVLRRLRDDSLLALGQNGVAHLGADRRVLAKIATKKEAFSASVGPGADELVTAEDGAINVYGLDGSLRRSAPIAGNAIMAEVWFDGSGRHAMYGAKGEIVVIDLVAMTSKTIARDTWNPPTPNPDGTVFGWLDRERTIHLVAPDGTPLRTIKPSIRANGITFSPSGDRIAAASERDLAVFDASGKELAAYEIDLGTTMLLVRDDDAWVGARDGVVRRYHGGVLVASLPLATTEVVQGALGRDAVAVVSSDSRLVLVRANAAQLREDAAPCERPIFGADGVAMIYSCDATARVFVGRRHIADAPTTDGAIFVAVDDASERAAIGGAFGIAVYDRAGARIAKRAATTGPIAFEDERHLLVVEDRARVRRWDVARDAWEDVARVPDITAIAVGARGAIVGTEAGAIVTLAGGARTSVGGRVDFISVSRDRRWLAAQLQNGATVIVSATTGEVARTLEPADSFGAAPAFDATGQLLARTSRGGMSIWDRTSGENLVFGLDLLRIKDNARFLPDGRLEVQGRVPALLDIAPDTRPAAQLVRDIAARTPLRVVDGRLEPAP